MRTDGTAMSDWGAFRDRCHRFAVALIASNDASSSKQSAKQDSRATACRLRKAVPKRKLALTAKTLLVRGLQSSSTPFGNRYPHRVALGAMCVLLIVGCGKAAPDYLGKAAAALEHGDKSAAISALREHLRGAPDSSYTRLKLGTLIRDSQPDEALDILGQIPRSDPKRIAAMQQIAIIQIVAGRTTDAEKALQEVVAAEPENMGAQLSLAELYFQKKDPEAALPHAIEAARLAPARAQSFLLVAEIYDDLHNYAAMIEPLQAAIDINPDYYEARLNLAYAFYRTGKLEPAETQAKWCHDANPRDVSPLRILATIARDQGHFADAEGLLTIALQIQPQEVDCRILEADLLLYKRQPQEAYERLKGIFDAQRNTVRYLGALARAAASAGERDEARKLYQGVEKRVQESRKAVELRRLQSPNRVSTPP